MDAIVVSAVIIFLVILRLSRRADYIFPLFPRRHDQAVEDVSTSMYKPQLECQQWTRQRRETISGSVDSSVGPVFEGMMFIKGSQTKEDVSVTKPVFLDGATHISETEAVYLDHEFDEQVFYALPILAKFTTRKNILAKSIRKIVSSYIDYLTSGTGKLADIRTMTNISTCNVICSIIFGHRLEIDDIELHNLRVHVNSTTVDKKSVSLINYISLLKYLQHDLFMAKKSILNTWVVYLGLLKTFVSVKRLTDVAFNDAENFIVAYFAERSKNVDVAVSSYMAGDGLTKGWKEFCGARIETMSSPINWYGIQIRNNFRLQDMVCREINEYLWPVQPSNIHCKTKLRRLNSAITETPESTDINSVSSHQTCSENASLSEHSIPKESQEILEVDSVLIDKTIKDNDVVTLKPVELLNFRKLQDRNELIPCKTGQRVALGETKGKIELSMFFSNVFQRA